MRRTGFARHRGVAVLAAAAVVAAGVGGVVGAGSAAADPGQVGYSADAAMLGTMRPDGFGQQVVCIGSGDAVPTAGQLGAERTATDYTMSYLMQKYSQTSDADTAAALAYLVKQAYDDPSSSSWAWSQSGVTPGDAKSPSNAALQQLLGWGHTGIQAEINALSADAAANAGAFGRSIAITENANSTPSTGNVTGVGVTSAAGNWQSGYPVTATLNGPAVFDATGTSSWSGTTAGNPESMAWHATGTGTVSVSEHVTGLPTSIGIYQGQNGYQGVVIAAAPGDLSASDPVDVPVVVKFSPSAHTTVKTPLVTGAGAPVIDTVAVSGAKPSAPVSGTATLYGPLGTEPVTSDTAPADVKTVGTVAWSGTTDANGNTTLDTPAVKVPGAGYYAWVETIDSSDVNNGYTSGFAESKETAMDYAPTLASKISEQTGIVQDHITDALSVSGVQTSLWSEPITTTAVPTVYGPLAPAAGSCTGLDWSGAATQKLAPVTVTGDGTITDAASFTPAPGQAGCYSVGYTASAAWDGQNLTVATEPAGDPSQTVLVYQPSIATQASAQTVTAGGTIADTVKITGTGGFAGVMTATLYGDLAPKTAGDCSSLSDADWRAAIAAKTVKALDVVTIPTDGDGQQLVTGQVGQAAGCVTWYETETIRNFTATTPYGVAAESAIVTVPSPSPTPTPSVTPSPSVSPPPSVSPSPSGSAVAAAGSGSGAAAAGAGVAAINTGRPGPDPRIGLAVIALLAAAGGTAAVISARRKKTAEQDE